VQIWSPIAPARQHTTTLNLGGKKKCKSGCHTGIQAKSRLKSGANLVADRASTPAHYHPTAPTPRLSRVTYGAPKHFWTLNSGPGRILTIVRVE